MACDKVLPTAVQFMVKKTHTHTQNPAENSTEWLENLIKLLATMSFCIKYCLLHLFTGGSSKTTSFHLVFTTARIKVPGRRRREVETTTRWNHRRVCDEDFTLHSLQLLLPPLSTFELEINQCVKFLGRIQRNVLNKAHLLGTRFVSFFLCVFPLITFFGCLSPCFSMDNF